MAIDYSSFINVLQDGNIWWRLEDAIKLGAGYQPARDEDRNLNPVLRANSNRIRVNERDLLAEFSFERYTEAHPRLLKRDDGRYVGAGEFLNWLEQYLAQNPSDIQFPCELANQVRKALAKAATERQAQAPQTFESLTLVLEGWFDKERLELPDALRQRVEFEFFPVPWDDLTAAQRQSAALQLDYQNDPATELERRKWWDFLGRKNDLEKEILHWESVSCPTAGELALKEDRLNQMRGKLALMKQQFQLARGDYYPERKSLDADKESAPKTDYIAFPKAMKILTDRLGATREELAAWIFMGPDTGGIAAYRNANELNPPPRFYFDCSMGEDYLSPLMACWFRQDEVDEYNPADRYITGTALIERWGKHPAIQAEAYIRAKIVESRLLDIHPTFGGTEGTIGDTSFPPLSAGLFAMALVEQVEAEDELDAFTPEVTLATNPQAPFQVKDQATSPPSFEGFSISLEGSVWKLTYQGITIHHKNNKGLRYIEVLARNPGKPIKVNALYREVNPPPPESIGNALSEQTDEELGNVGLIKGQLADREERIDQETLNQVRQRLNKLRDLIEDAEERGDKSKKDELETEREKILEYLKANLGKDGQPRNTNPIDERIRKAIGSAIKEAIKSISSQHQALGAHLEACISTGNAPCYKPPHVIP